MHMPDLTNYILLEISMAKKIDPVGRPMPMDTHIPHSVHKSSLQRAENTQKH